MNNDKITVVNAENVNEFKSMKSENISPSNEIKKKKVKDSSFNPPATKTMDSETSKKRKLSKNEDISQQKVGDISVKISPLSKKLKVNHDIIVNESHKGSIAVGEESLKWIISPHKTKKFLNQYFEKNVLHIQRNDKDYYKHVFSCKSFDKLLRNSEKPLIYGKNIDITSYTEKEGRETHTPEGGRAHAAVVWDYYTNGCSIRIINPQTFSDPVWKLCSDLQDYFGSMVGANVYLTPPGTQGFAPHFDDVDVFILQLEGKKHWRLYEPNDKDKLPRFSSRNFTQEEIGKPFLETTLSAGDFLYMPRGTIHQGYCLEDIHSLHITISCHQRNTYGDLLEKALSTAIASAMKNDVDFRKGLPVDYLSFMGKVHCNKESTKRNEFIKHVTYLASKVIDVVAIDTGADLMGKRFVHDTLPPYLTPSESDRCVENGGEKWHSGKSKVVNRVEMEPDTTVRLIRANCIRLVEDVDKSYKLYYNVDNTREYHEIGEDPNFLEIDEDTMPCVQALIQAYPNFLAIEKLPIEDLEQKMKIAQDMWEKKLLMTEERLEPFKFDDD